jgi:hypothetical protein
MSEDLEVWLDVPNYEGSYQVSDLGRVKSKPRLRKTKGNGICRVQERILKFAKDQDGYKFVVLQEMVRNGR